MDEIPGGQAFENAVNSFNKKAAGAMMGVLKRILATASEPFWRKDLGERFFTGDVAGGAVAVWTAATGASCLTGNPLIGALGDLLHSREFTKVFGSGWTTGIVGLLFTWMYLKFCIENGKRLRQFRDTGQLYHSFSRGVPRWDSLVLPWVIIGLILLFVPILGILFLVASGLSMKLEKEQQATIYSKYLDALDQRIEKEFMEQALLGECEPQITYLANPLPNDIDPEVRRDMASAAVGKPVALATVGPRSRKKKSEDALTPPSGESPSVEVVEPKPEPRPEALLVKPETVAVVAAIDSKVRAKARPIVIGLLLVAVAVAGISMFRASRNEVRAAESRPTPQPSSEVEQYAVVKLAPRPEPKPEQKPEPAVEPVAMMRPTGPTPEEIRRASDEALAAAKAKRQQEREQAFQQIRDTIALQQTEAGEFHKTCLETIASNTNRIEKLTRSVRNQLRPQNQKLQLRVEKLFRFQTNFLNQSLTLVESLAANPNSTPAATSKELAEIIVKMENERQQVADELGAMDAEIARSPKSGSGFLRFR